jgi:protein gp37
MADLFGDWVEEKHILRVLDIIQFLPRHTFLLLTKNPRRLHEFTFPDNAQVGVTVDGENNSTLDSYCDYSRLSWVSFEPLVKDMLDGTQGDILKREGFKWVVIGALSAGGKKYQPEPSWVEHILEAAEGLPVFMKDNLDCEALGITRRQELP